MQAFLQKRSDEDKAAQQEIKNLSGKLERCDCSVVINSIQLYTTFFLTELGYYRGNDLWEQRSVYSICPFPWNH